MGVMLMAKHFFKGLLRSEAKKPKDVQEGKEKNFRCKLLVADNVTGEERNFANLSLCLISKLIR